MERLSDFLISVELLKGLSKHRVEAALLPFGSCQTYIGGEAVYLPHDRVSDVKILLSGKVNIVNYLDNGSRDLQSQLLPGVVLGLELLGTRTQLSPYHAVAAENSEIFSFPSRLIFEPGFLTDAERCQCLRNILYLVSQINMKKEYRLAILTYRSLRERVLVYLTMQANRRQTASFSIPFSREELASFLCVNRSALSHELSLLRQEGLIEFHKNRFTLKNWSKAGDAIPYR